jgi:hypothetical protein
MRLASFTCFFFVAVALSSAQNTDTNFSTGPQYLINPNSPFLLRSIATPTLSLSAPPATTPTASPEEDTGEPHTPAFPDLQNQGQIDRVYWGVPSIGTNAGSGEMPAENPTENKEINGEIGPSEVQPSKIGLNSPQPIPHWPSLFNVGVTGMANPESLREHGYGISLGDVAAYWKAHKPHATRVYTNADVASLRGD